MSLLIARLCLMLVGLICLFTMQTDGTGFDFREAIPESFSRNPLPLTDQAKITALQSLDVSEWLGPMAPVALSPFFGITCLAALSQFGGDFLPANSFLSSNPVLNNPTVLWTFAILTLLTSLPRLTKVSKPAAQALDILETYAAIITIVVIRVFATSNSQPETEMAVQAATVLHMGMFSFTADMLLSIAAIINILVINGVKFFCEVMIWLTPFPFVDALLEVANKSLCAALMAVYAYSPTIATIINLALFVGCLIVFRWTNRQAGYLRSVLVDPLRAYLQPSYGVPVHDQLEVFPQSAFGPFPAKARLRLTTTETGWLLSQHKFLLPDVSMPLDRDAWQMDIKPGMLLNHLAIAKVHKDRPADNEVPDQLEIQKLLFSRRYSDDLPKLSELLKTTLISDVVPQSITI